MRHINTFANQMSSRLEWGTGANREELFAPVKSEPVKFRDDDTGHVHIYREHEGIDKPISIMSEQYQIIQASEVHEAIMDTCPIKIVHDETHSRLMAGGRRFELAYNLPDVDKVFDKLDDGGYKARISSSGSYDGSTKHRFNWDAWRIICTNGMRGWAKEAIVELIHKGLELSPERRRDTIWGSVHSLLENIGEKYGVMIDRMAEAMAIKTASVGADLYKKLGVQDAKVLAACVALTWKSGAIEAEKIGVEIESAFPKMDDEGRKSFIDDSGRLLSEMYGYPEEVKNLWGFYNLLIKALQARTTNMERRMKQSAIVTNYFFGR